VDLRKLSDYLGFEVRIADAAAVRRSTGYVIGGFRLSPTTRA